MSVAITFLFTAAITLLVLFTVGTDVVTSFAQLSGSWTGFQDRAERKVDTRISGPPGQWAGQDPTVKLVVANTGKVPLRQFDDWDVVFETQQSPGLGISYLTYTSGTPSGANEWTVDGIYRDASDLSPETLDPGVLNAGEEMVVLAKPDPPVVLDTFDRATFSTPNGVTAEVIFEIIVTPTPTP